MKYKSLVLLALAWSGTSAEGVTKSLLEKAKEQDDLSLGEKALSSLE
jgi:hypothetical protein